MKDIEEANNFLDDLKCFYQKLGEKTSRAQVLGGLYHTQLIKELIKEQAEEIKKLKEKNKYYMDLMIEKGEEESN